MKKKLFVAIPTIGSINDAAFYALRKIEEKYKDKVEFIYPEQCVRRIFHDFARNGMVEDFLKSDADILFFLDSDVAPPTDILDILDEEWDVAGAPYPIMMTPAGQEIPQIVFTAYKGKGSRGFSMADVPQEGKEFIDGVATGCMFIKRHIFDKLDKPYFEFKYDEESRMLTSGEDLGFCQKINNLGYKFFVDYSKVCKHYKHVCLLDINNYCLDYAQKSVKKYDALVVQPKLNLILERIKEKKQSKEAKQKLVLPERFQTGRQG
jgi:hypothetical protein